MKKKTAAVFMVIVMVISLLSGCGKADSDNRIKVGITIQSLKNAYWAGVMGQLKVILDENGYDYILVDCDDNAANQISQIENFIVAGCDLIMVHPSNPDAIDFVCGEARKAGIKVMCWDDIIENSDVNWVLDNMILGEEIGKEAAEFINGHYTSDKPAEAVIIGDASTPVLLERSSGIKSGLEKYCDKGKYVIVSEIDGLEANHAQTNCETVLQSHPNAKVFMGVSAGSMIGSNEALITKYGKGNIPEDCGIFSADVTVEQLNSILAGDEAARSVIGFEGSNRDTALACFDMFEHILGSEGFDENSKNIFRAINPISKDEAEAILANM